LIFVRNISQARIFWKFKGFLGVSRNFGIKIECKEFRKIAEFEEFQEFLGISRSFRSKNGISKQKKEISGISGISGIFRNF
jgi:hypothetical protein